MRESKYQRELIGRLETMFPGCMVLKNNPQNLQGVPDVLILHSGTWGALEVKQASNSPIQPNQRYYVDKMAEMSFAAFICPENEEEVLYELQQALESGRQARVS